MVSEELSVADVAFTEEPTLAVPNFMAYRECAAQLLQDSRVEEFWLLWRSVAEVVHVPPAPMPTAAVNFAGVESLSGVLFVGKHPAHVAIQLGEASNFRGWDHGARITSPQDAYAAYSRCHDRLAREALQGFGG